MSTTRQIAIGILQVLTQSSNLPFKILWQNNTYTILMITNINDEAVSCNPGNLRSFITIVIEHRTEDSGKVSFVLVPPTLRDGNHRFNALREQAVALTNNPSKYHQTFITLLSFNKERLQLDDLQAGFEKVAEEIEYLKQHGAPRGEKWSEPSMTKGKK